MATAAVIYTRAGDNGDAINVPMIAGRFYVVLAWDSPDAIFQVDGQPVANAELSHGFAPNRVFGYAATTTSTKQVYAGRITFVAELTGVQGFNNSIAGLSADIRYGTFNFSNAVDGSALGFAFVTSTGSPVSSSNMSLAGRVDSNAGPHYLFSFVDNLIPSVAIRDYTAAIAFGLAGAATGRVLNATPAALALTARQATVRLGHVLPVQPRSILLGLTPARLARGRRMLVATASLAATARPAAVLLGHTLPVQPAALTLSAPAVRIGVGLRLAATPAALALTTGGAMLRAVRLLAAQTTSIVVTGQAVAVRAGRRLRVEAAAIVATGGSAALNRVGRLALAVTPAAIAVDAAAATVRMVRVLRAAPAAIGVEAQAVRLAVQRRLRVAPASISLFGAAVSLRLGSAAIPIPSAGRTIVIVDQGSRSLLIGDAGSRRLII